MKIALLGSAVLAALLLTGCDETSKDENPVDNKGTVTVERKE